jgi:hypothetical protein
MNAQIGRHGGQALRRFTLFGESYKFGDEIGPEVFEKLDFRHLDALKGQGIIKFYDNAPTPAEPAPMPVQQNSARPHQNKSSRRTR